MARCECWRPRATWTDTWRPGKEPKVAEGALEGCPLPVPQSGCPIPRSVSDLTLFGKAILVISIKFGLFGQSTQEVNYLGLPCWWNSTQ